MYIPEYFREKNEDQIFAFLQANAFGQLISHVEGRLFCTHLPMLLADDRKSLLGHLAKANPQWQELMGQEVLVTFQGPHDYVSPSWYSKPAVPTWNYQAVHVYGHCALIEQETELAQMVDDLSRVYESAFETPWQPQYAAAMLKSIVGVRIEISEIQCKFKISQNRSLQDQENVAEQYKLSGQTDLYQVMQHSIQQQNSNEEDLS